MIPLYSNQSPPTVNLTVCTSFVCGLRLDTNIVYVTLCPCGITCCLMNPMVLVPVLIRVPTPCTSIPSSLDRACDHNAFTRVCRRYMYSYISPVIGFIIELHCCVLVSGGGPISLLILKIALTCYMFLDTATL